MIEPTIGRVVWIYGRRSPTSPANPEGKPEAATIAWCWFEDGRWYLNVGGLNHLGMHFNLTSVQLIQDTADSDVNTAHPFATWMPYQKGQAAKTEALEKQIGHGG